MAGVPQHYLGAEQQPEPGAQLAAAFFSAASRPALDVAPSTLVTSIPGGASNAVLAIFALGSTFSCPTSFASLASAGSTFTISAAAANCGSALNSLTPFMAASFALVCPFCKQTNTSFRSCSAFRHCCIEDRKPATE